MRFHLDEDISVRVAAIARSRGCDVTASQELGRNGLDDAAQLRLAATDGRCLVTRNARHFWPTSRTFAELGLPHAGVLLVPSSLPGSAFAALAGALERYADSHPDGVAAYSVDYLRTR